MISLIKKRLARHLAFYVFFSFLNKGLSFLLIPLFTRYLSPKDYGVYALFLTGLLISEPFLSFCSEYAIGNVYYKQSQYSIREYVGTLLILCIGFFIIQITCLGTVIFAVKSFVIPKYFLLVPIVAMSSIMLNTLGWMWQMTERPISYGIFNSCYISLNLFFQIIVLVFFKLGLIGILYSQTILAVINIFAGVYILIRNKWLSFCFNKECLKFGLKFGMGYIPNLLAMRVNDSIGKLFVTQKFDLVSTGIYSLGQKLGMVVNVYSMSFISAYRPWLFKKLSAVDCLDKRKIALSIAFAYISITLFAFAGSLCVYFLSDIFLGKNFKGALAYVLWSASAYAINGLYGIIAQFIYYTGKSWILSFHTIFATCLNAFLTFLFLNKFGMIGAAYAPTIAWTATLILAVFVTLKLWKNRLSQPESHSKTLEL